MFYFTLHFKMFTREEIFKMAEENVSIAKYLKPEVRDEVQVKEEELQKAIEESLIKEDEFKECKIIIMNLAKIIIDNIEVRNQPPALSPIYKDLQKINRIKEIISKLEDIQNNLEGIKKDDCTKEEWNKRCFLYILILSNKAMFMKAQNILLEVQEIICTGINELLRDLINTNNK